MNEGRYDREEYEGESIKKYSYTTPIPLQIQRPALAKTFVVQKVNVEYTDNLFVDLFSKSKSFFEIREEREFPAYTDNQKDLVMQLRYMMSLDELTHSRTVYNLLDYLGDVGGCLDALIYLGTFLVWILTGDSLSNFIISKLFKYDDSPEPENSSREDYA